MEFLNKIEIQGVVGRADVITINNSRMCKFSVVTEYNTIDRDGNRCNEVTWFNVSYWEGRDTVIDFSPIKKGAWVNLVGRLRLRHYTGDDGSDRMAVDVIAGNVQVLDKDGGIMQPQRD